MKTRKYALLKRLFRQYQDGNAPEREKKIIDNWFQNYQEGPVPDLLDDPEATERIYNELSERITRGMARSTPVRHLWSSPIWIKVACVIGVLFLGGVLYNNHKPPEISVPQQSWQTISTANGQVRKLILDDGTEVWLNAATTIRVAVFRDDQKRTVYLDKGEAFFRVKHEPARPFRVISGNLITRDIGTAFNIRAYDLNSEYRVAVSSGKVEVSRADPSGKLHILSAGIGQGEVLVYHPEHQHTIVTRKDAELMSAWRSGTSLYMEDMTLTQIGEELSRHFNIRVTVAEPRLDTNRYTIAMANHSLSEVLQRLILNTGMSYSLDQHHLTINPSDKRMK
jgi:ferric-dicitrate binding protein FerR (iron transport regulator)